MDVGELIATCAMLENERSSLNADRERIVEESKHDKIELEKEKDELTDDIHRLKVEIDQLKLNNRGLQNRCEECIAQTCSFENEVEKLQMQLQSHRQHQLQLKVCNY